MKKPKKSDAEMLFSRIKQTPAPIQDPLKTEKFHSADGERIDIALSTTSAIQ